MKKRAYQYVRVSSRGQLDGHGIDRQKRAIASYAKKNRIQLVETFEEQETGTTEHRPELAKMLKRLKQNPDVRFVLVEKLDRVARDLIVQERVVARLRELEVNLISVVEGEDLLSQDPTRKFIRQTLGAVAELDKSLLVEKLRLSREQIRSTRGRCEGRKPIEAVEPELLAELKRLRRKRPGKRCRSYAQIAEILNERQIPTVTGKPWSAWMARYFLTQTRSKRLVTATTSPK